MTRPVFTLEEGVQAIESQYGLKCVYQNHELEGTAAAPIGKVTLKFDLTDAQYEKVAVLKGQKLTAVNYQLLPNNQIIIVAQCTDDMRILFSVIAA